MSVIYTVQGAGAYVAFGLSTDVKPVSPATDSMFIEMDTDNTYLASGGVWTIATHKKTVRAVTDFPTPSANVITLEDNTTYIINGTVDIGSNRIACGTKNTFIGFDKQNDILTSSTSGALLTLDSSGTDKVSLTLNTLGLRCPNGTIFNVTSSALRNVFIIDNCNLTTCVNIGTVNNCSSFVVRTSAFLTASASGVTFTGTNANFSVKDSQFRTVAGTGGTAITIAGLLKRRTSGMGSSLMTAGDMRIATTAALGAGTKTLETLSLSTLAVACPITASLNGMMIPPGTILWQAEIADGEHPLILAQNEGFSIRSVAIPATGTWTASITVDWAEVVAY